MNPNVLIHLLVLGVRYRYWILVLTYLYSSSHCLFKWIIRNSTLTQNLILSNRQTIKINTLLFVKCIWLKTTIQCGLYNNQENFPNQNNNTTVYIYIYNVHIYIFNPFYWHFPFLTESILKYIPFAFDLLILNVKRLLLRLNISIHLYR